MKYVSMDLAMNYLMNQRTIFDKVKDSFLDSYQDYQKKFWSMVDQKDYQNLEIYIHAIKGISLNLGAQMLYDSAVLALVFIKNQEWDERSIQAFYEVLDHTYQELKSL